MDVVRLRTDQLDEASAVLARAFHDDPAWTWVLPDAKRRAALLPWLFRTGFETMAADLWTTPGRVLGVSRWLAPGRPVLRVGTTLRVCVATPLRLREATSRYLQYGRAVEDVRARAARGPHWYLAGIGVDPAEQRKGIGAALLQPGLRAAREAGVPAVLLTNLEANLSFYERHGFEVVLEADTPNGPPHAWAMVKRP